MSKILIVDDEPRSVKLLRLRFEEIGHLVKGAGSLKDASLKLKSELFDLLITDVRLPDGSGINLIKYAKKIQPDLPIVVITAYGTIQDAIKAMQLGVADYIQKPFELEAMIMLTNRILKSAKIKAEHLYLMNELMEGESKVNLVGNSKAMQKVRELIAKVATSRSNVLLLGESGTGKELVAHAIHTNSEKKNQPLIKVNCPGIPAQLFESEIFGHMKGAFTGAIESRKGKFELAGKGNILLDEISEIPLELQAKLLRVLEDRCFTRVGGSVEIKTEARIIAATNRNLQAMVKKGRFRDDLYYRLNVFPIQLPPLRERKEDIQETITHLLCHVGKNCGFVPRGLSERATSTLIKYDWPGNVRELRNVLERALVLASGEIIKTKHLPVEIQEESQDSFIDDEKFNLKVNDYKKSLLLKALNKNNWSKKNAASELGLSQRAFTHYVNKFNLDACR